MKTIIITGASDGIGRASAIQISKVQEFDNIVLIARNGKALFETSMQIDKKANVHTVPFDLSAVSEIPELVTRVYKKFGSIDCLINSAGYADPQPLLHTSFDNLLNTFTINTIVPIILMRECVKYMKEKKSTKIINIASTAGSTPRPGWLSYSSSKAALIAASKTLSEELAEYGVKVYCISPGRCATNLRRKLAPDEDQTRIMQPEEIASIIANISLDSEKYLDGQNIIIRRQ